MDQIDFEIFVFLVMNFDMDYFVDVLEMVVVEYELKFDFILFLNFEKKKNMFKQTIVSLRHI